MMEYRNIHANSERGGMTLSRYRDVPPPARTDGIGVALRRAFATDGGDDGFLTLLQELDRQTKC